MRRYLLLSILSLSIFAFSPIAHASAFTETIINPFRAVFAPIAAFMHQAEMAFGRVTTPHSLTAASTLSAPPPQPVIKATTTPWTFSTTVQTTETKEIAQPAKREKTASPSPHQTSDAITKGVVLGASISDGVVTQSELQIAIEQSSNALRQLIYANAGTVGQGQYSSGGYTNSIALTNRIDQLSGTKLSNITVDGVSGLTAADIPTNIVAAKYLPLTGGTLTGPFAVDPGNLTGFSLSPRTALAGLLPVPTFRPTTPNMNVALDIGPNGTPPDDFFGNGYAWLDVCDADPFTTNPLLTCGRIGALANAIEIGSRSFGGVPKPVWLTVNGATLMTLATSSNVGIAQAIPAYRLDVNGVGRFTSIVDASNFVATSSAATSTFAGGLSVGTNKLLVSRSTGNVGIGTTSPSSRLTIWGSDSASSTSSFAVVNSASTTLFSVFNGGNAQLSGTLTQSSDKRLKINISSLDASSSLAAINSLTPVTYNWLDPEKDGVRQYGFIAQQVQQVFPELVSTTSATALTPDGTLGLNYLGLIAPLVEAVQGLSTRLSSLEAIVVGFANSFTSKKVTTEELCFADQTGQTCVTKSQIDRFLSGTPSVQISAPTPPVISGTTTPPSIDIAGNNPAHINIGGTYSDLGAIVTDNQGHDLSYRTFINSVLSGNIFIDTSHVATDTIDYVATDTWGNTATATRTVIIEAATSSVI